MKTKRKIERLKIVTLLILVTLISVSGVVQALAISSVPDNDGEVTQEDMVDSTIASEMLGMPPEPSYGSKADACARMGDPPADCIWVEPSFTDTLQMCETFTVDVMVNITAPTPGPDGIPGTPDDGNGLYAWEYKLKWNSTVINLTSYTVRIPPEWGGNYFIAEDEVGHYPDCTDYHWLAVTALVPAPSVVGVRSLCTYTFHVKYQPYEPEPAFVGTLDIQDDRLYDDTFTRIPHTTYDGQYRIHTIPVPKPTLYVDPPSVTVFECENFTIDIRIKDLAAVSHLSGWEVKLGYNTTLLDALASEEGSFLPGFAGPGGTWYVNIIDDTLGIVHTAGGFLDPPAAWPYGTGVLAKITFHCTGVGECVLDLYDTKLIDDLSQPIDHYVEDGYVIQKPPPPIHDIAIIAVAPCKTVVGRGFKITIHATLKNKGNFTETFTVWTFCGCHINITLVPSSSITINYTFDTSKLQKGNYTLWAYVPPCFGDKNPIDNLCVGGTFRVNMPGDIRPEFGIVDIFDLVAVGIRYKSEKGKPPPPGAQPYEEFADVNNDGIIDIFDLVIIGIHYNEKG